MLFQSGHWKNQHRTRCHRFVDRRDRHRNVYNGEYHRRVTDLTPSAQSALTAHHWPGNIRELRNCIERAMIFVEGERIDRADILIDSLSVGKEPHSSFPLRPATGRESKPRKGGTL